MQENHKTAHQRIEEYIGRLFAANAPPIQILRITEQAEKEIQKLIKFVILARTQDKRQKQTAPIDWYELLD